jgi:hypothetical protein
MKSTTVMVKTQIAAIFLLGLRVFTFGIRLEEAEAPSNAERRPLNAERRTLLESYQPSTQEKIKGTTMVASDSIMNFGVSSESLPQVIFSFGTAPEYDP